MSVYIVQSNDISFRNPSLCFTSQMFVLQNKNFHLFLKMSRRTTAALPCRKEC